MGGVGSGRWPGKVDEASDRKASVNEVPAFHVGELRRAGVLKEGASGWLPPCRGGDADPGFIAFSFRSNQLRLHFDESGPNPQARETIAVLRTPCHFGGSRPWFVCPGRTCGKRVGVLYVKDRRLRCRTCQKLAYPSQRRTELQRLKDRATQLRSKLGGWSGFLVNFPARPKGMHMLSYNTLCMEIAGTEMRILEIQQRKIEQLMSRQFGYRCRSTQSLDEHWAHVLGLVK